ncbi:MAG: hypothetical protein C0596_08185 [Marinilabiliales bacterium]|nr:MAG: hypothetical protein C0596_08185 [Marinilabiliales bacterium]
MKKSILFLLAFTISLGIFAQGAGNWTYQNKAKVSTGLDYSSELYGGFEQDNSGYYQTNTYNWSNYGSNDTVIYLDVKALMNVEPDTYILILGLSQISENLETCFELIDQRIASFISEGEINQEDVYVDFISQTPIFAREKEKKIFSKKYVEVPKGFEIKKNIHIRFTDSKLADQYLKLAAKNEIYDIIKVDYIVNDHKAVYDTLRKECIKLINQYVADYKTMGLNFEAMYKSMEETNSCTYPISRYSYFSSYMPTNYDPITGNDSEMNLVNPNEKINIFYDKLPYNYYDIIINPDAVTPVVQFSQSVKIKFVLKKNQ